MNDGGVGDVARVLRAYLGVVEAFTFFPEVSGTLGKEGAGLTRICTVPYSFLIQYSTFGPKQSFPGSHLCLLRTAACAEDDFPY